jgi:hypothetical protein
VACGAAGEELGQLRGIQAEAHAWRGNNVAAEQRGLEALAHLPRGSVAWFTALGEVVPAAGKLIHVDRVRALIAELACEGEPSTPAHAIAYARAAIQTVYLLRGAEARELVPPLRAAQARFHDNPGVLAWIAQALACQIGIGVGVEEGIEMHRRTIEHFDQVGDRRNAWIERGVHGLYLSLTGSPAEAEPFLRAALIESNVPALMYPAIFARLALGTVQLAQGQLEDAAITAAAAVEHMARLASPSAIFVITVLGLEGRVLHRLGRTAEATERALHALEVLRRMLVVRPDRWEGVFNAQAPLMRLLVDCGHAAEAAALVTEVGATPDEDQPFTAAIYGAHACALRALGDTAGADRALAAAWRLVRAYADAILDPARRERFLDGGFGGLELRAEVRRWLDPDA